MQFEKNNFGRLTRKIGKGAILGVLAISVAGCVVEPFPPPPPPPMASPAPGYYAAPCCYAYPEYPPGYYYPGPSVGLAYTYGGGGYYGGYRHWR